MQLDQIMLFLTSFSAFLKYHCDCAIYCVLTTLSTNVAPNSFSRCLFKICFELKNLLQTDEFKDKMVPTKDSEGMPVNLKDFQDLENFETIVKNHNERVVQKFC